MSIIGFNEPETARPCICLEFSESFRSRCPMCNGTGVSTLDERCARGEHDWLKVAGFDPMGMLDKNGSPMVVFLTGSMKGEEIFGRDWNEEWICQREDCMGMHFEPTEPPKMYWPDTVPVDGERRLVGYCPVDSGQVWVGDPCYVMHGVPVPSWNAHPAQRPNQAGPWADGVQVHSGFGDGTYEVWATYIDSGDWGVRVAKIEVIFIEPQDLVDDDAGQQPESGEGAEL